VPQDRYDICTTYYLIKSKHEGNNDGGSVCAGTLPQLCGVDPHLDIHITLSRGEKEARTIAKESKSRARVEAELEHE